MRQAEKSAPPWPPSSKQIEVREFDTVTRVTVPSRTSKIVTAICIAAGVVSLIAIVRIFVPDRFVPEHRLTERSSAVMISLFGIVALFRLSVQTTWLVFELEGKTLSLHEFNRTRQPRTVVRLDEFRDARYTDDKGIPRLEMLAVGDQRGSGLRLVENDNLRYRRLDMIRIARWIRDEMRDVAAVSNARPDKAVPTLDHRRMLDYEAPFNSKVVACEQYPDGVRVAIPPTRSSTHRVVVILASVLMGLLGIGMLASIWFPEAYNLLGIRSQRNSADPAGQTVLGVLLTMAFALPFANQSPKAVVIEHRRNHLLLWEFGGRTVERRIVDLTDIHQLALGTDEGTLILLAVASELGVENEIFRFPVPGSFKNADLQHAIQLANDSIDRYRNCGSPSRA